LDALAKLLPGPVEVPNEDDDEKAMKASSAEVKSAQPTLMSSFAKATSTAKKLTAEEKKDCNRALALLAAGGNLPLSIGERKWFKYFCRKISRGQYEGASHPTVLKYIHDINRVEVEPAMRAELTNVRSAHQLRALISVLLGCRICGHDGFVDLAQDSRLSGSHRSLHLTGLGANGGEQFACCIIFSRFLFSVSAYPDLVSILQLLVTFKHVEGSHTSENVANEIKESLNAIDKCLLAKLTALNADGAKNAQGSIGQFEGTWNLWCSCHILNLIIRKSFDVSAASFGCALICRLQTVKSALTNVRAVGKATRASTLAADDLKAVQERLSMRKTQIALDVVTRWTSILRYCLAQSLLESCRQSHRMLKSALANRVPLEIVSSMPSVRKHAARKNKESKSAQDILDKWDDVSDEDPVVFDSKLAVKVCNFPLFCDTQFLAVCLDRNQTGC